MNISAPTKYFHHALWREENVTGRLVQISFDDVKKDNELEQMCKEDGGYPFHMKDCRERYKKMRESYISFYLPEHIAMERDEQLIIIDTDVYGIVGFDRAKILRYPIWVVQHSGHRTCELMDIDRNNFLLGDKVRFFVKSKSEFTQIISPGINTKFMVDSLNRTCMHETQRSFHYGGSFRFAMRMGGYLPCKIYIQDKDCFEPGDILAICEKRNLLFFAYYIGHSIVIVNLANSFVIATTIRQLFKAFPTSILDCVLVVRGEDDD